jgi:hypothetical protein
LCRCIKEVERVVVRRIETAVTTAFKRRENEAVSVRKDLEFKADEMLESQARRACELASSRAEGAAKEATEAARKCGEAGPYIRLLFSSDHAAG